VAGIGLAEAVGSVAPPPRLADKTARAGVLAAAPVTDRRGPVYTAATARAAARLKAASVPLPAGGTFDGIRWELGGDGVGTGDIEATLQYNAACQWLRAWRDGRDAALAVRVLQTAPSWPAMRGTESGEWLARVAADVSAGGGETATAVLADCDASHAREVEYAARLNLTPSR
jgi:hypothetical protein